MYEINFEFEILGCICVLSAYHAHNMPLCPSGISVSVCIKCKSCSICLYFRLSVVSSQMFINCRKEMPLGPWGCHGVLS